MSIFPTKILLATDGSSEAELATRTAADLAQKTGSELHVIHVLDVAQIAMFDAGATDDPEGIEHRIRSWRSFSNGSQSSGARRCSTRKWNGYGRLVGQSHRRI